MLVETQEQKENLINELKVSVMKIKFKKLDGETRIITCTLNDQLLPKVLNEDNVDKKPRKKSLNTLSVWDLEKNDWRSMRWDNIMEFYKNGQ
jgi:hypothetical protein